MKCTLWKGLSYTLILLITCLNFSYSQGYSLQLGPEDLLIRAYDNEIDASGTDQISIMVLRPIEPGTSFSLTNGIYNSGGLGGQPTWTTSSGDPVAAQTITYIGTNSIDPGDNICIKIPKSDSSTSAYIEDIDINGVSSNNLFEVHHSGLKLSPDINMPESGEGSLYIVQGSWIDDQGQARLSGEVIDGIAYGINVISFNSRGKPDQLAHKDILLNTSSGSQHGYYKVTVCDACPIQEDLADKTKWSISAGNSSNYLAAKLICDERCDPPFCDGVLTIDQDSCSLTVIGANPCDTVDTYSWQELIDGQYVNVPHDSLNPETFIPDGDGVFQLVVTCTDSCVFISNTQISTCYECLSTVNISLTECTLQASVSNCTNPQFQWQESSDGITYTNITGATADTLAVPQSGFYYLVKVTGCAGCAEIQSDPVYVVCEQGCVASLNIMQTFECYIEVSWTGCTIQGKPNWEFYSAAAGPCNPAGPYTSIFPTTIDQSINGPTGHWTILPSEGEGCYQFVLDCIECDSTLTASIFRQDCCFSPAVITSEEETVDLSSYCMLLAFNGGELQEISDVIVNLPGSGLMSLDTVAGFDFGYCIFDNPPTYPCSNPSSDVDDLITDLNAWLSTIGQGTAYYYPNGETLTHPCCDGFCRFSLISVECTDIPFESIDIDYSDSGGSGTETSNFFETDCESDTTGNLILTVSQVCGSNSIYNWSTGATTQSIVVADNSGVYSVTVTCPDECDYPASFDTGSAMSLAEQEASPEVEATEKIIEQAEEEQTEVWNPVKNKLKVFPNPSMYEFTVIAESLNVQPSRVSLIDLIGKKVFTREVNLIVGENRILVNHRDIPPGMYLLSLGLPGEYSVERVILIR